MICSDLRYYLEVCFNVSHLFPHPTNCESPIAISHNRLAIACDHLAKASTTWCSGGRRTWSKSVGPYGHRIRLFVDAASDIDYAEMRDESNPCGYRSYSLRHRDKKKAELWAQAQVAKWMANDEQPVNRAPELSRVLALYLKHQTPGKVASEQQGDHRPAKMWTRVRTSDVPGVTAGQGANGRLARLLPGKEGEGLCEGLEGLLPVFYLSTTRPLNDERRAVTHCHACR
jgi:hypothetical protein